MWTIRSSKDFWAGAFFVGLGLAAVLIGRNYRMGSAAAMGPAYFPTVLGALLMLVGAVAIIRSFRSRGEAVQPLAFKPLILIPLACAAFGLLLVPAGFVIALLALCLISASASRNFRFDPVAALAMIGLITFCSLVFVKFFQLPMPLLGTWFTGNG